MGGMDDRFEGWHKLHMDHAGLGIALFDLDGNIVMMNRKARESISIAPKEVEGRSSSEVFGTEWGETIRRRMDDVIAAGASFTYEDKTPFSTGARWFRSTYTPIPDDTGHFIGIQMISDDISDLKFAVKALQESEEKYSLLFESVLNGFAIYEIVLDDDEKPVDYIFLDVNPAFEKFTSLKLVNILGKRITEILPRIVNGPIDWIGRYEKVVLTGKETKFELLSETQDKWFSILAFSPKKGQFVTIFEDITERKRAEKIQADHVQLLENLGRIDRAIRASTTPDRTLTEVIDTVLHMFECDRVWLLFPCDPDTPSFRIPFESNRPEYPGARTLDLEISMTPTMKEEMISAIAVDDPVTSGPGNDKPISLDVHEQFGVQTQMLMEIHPKTGPSWIFGMHQCSHARIWTDTERKLFNEVGRRIGDSLSSLLFFRDLQESEAKLLMAQYISKMGDFTWNIQTGAVSWSDGMYRLLKYDRDEVVDYAKVNEAIHHPEDLERVTKWLMDGIASEKEELVPNEYRLVCKDGEIIHVQTNGRIEYSHGKALKLFGTCLNITERRRTEEALEEREGKLRNIIENSTNLFYSHTPDHILTYLSPQIEKLLGYTAEEAMIRWTELASDNPINEEGFRITLAAIESGKAQPPYELELVHKSGKKIMVEVREAPVVKDGKTAAIVGVLTDITDRKRDETEIKNMLTEIRELKDQLEAENVYLLEEIRMAHPHGTIVAEGKGMQSVLAQAEQVASTDSTVLILGETGTGKELLARAIHRMSSRKKRPMIVVNCAAIPDTLVESELFGREKGAYTGALTKLVGRFEIADGSTIFLDEIGDLPFNIQAKLLRVLQDGQFERLGSEKTITVDVRIIAATNHDLEREAAQKTFREDLFYRLNVFPITVPPLRERKEDIEPLAWSFVSEFGERMGKRIEGISRESMDALLEYSWPGNVRELRNVMERAMIQTKGKRIQISLPDPPSLSRPDLRTLAERERQHILDTLEQNGWRIRGKGGTAESLDLKPTTLEARMKKLGIRRPDKIKQ